MPRRTPKKRTHSMKLRSSTVKQRTKKSKRPNRTKRVVRSRRTTRPNTRQKACSKDIMRGVMHNYKYGSLRSGTGATVVSRKQALKIGFSEVDKYCIRRGNVKPKK